MFSPLASADVIGHEFGHGITHFNIGWQSGEHNEGMSDIWGSIFKHAIDSTSQYWKIGDQITKRHSCLRNLENPADPGAITAIVDTYGSNLYNTTQNYYVKSGVFSHWFYLLVNGGRGTNGIGNSYIVNGIGMDIAEKLIVNTVYGGYLRGTQSYEDIRNAFIQAATEEMDDSDIVMEISNAWYAVGVGTKLKLTISGNTLVCGETIYSIEDKLPANTVFSWSTNNSNLLLVSGQGTKSAVFKRNGRGSCEVNAEATINSYSITDTLKVWVGEPDAPKLSGTKLNELYTTGSTYIFRASNSREEGIEEYEWTASGGTIAPYDNGRYAVFSPNISSGMITVTARARNNCGWGNKYSVRGRIDNENAPMNAKATGIDNINTTNPLSYRIEIWNNTGLLKVMKMHDTEYDKYLKQLPRGLYFIRIIRGSNVAEKRKVLIP